MIELKQLIGRRREPDGSVSTIAHPVDAIYWHGHRVGFVARQPEAPITFTKWMHRDEQRQICEAIAQDEKRTRAFGPPSGKTYSPPMQGLTEQSDG